MSITEIIPNFLGGYCTTPSELVDCATLSNCVINRDGSVQGRSGYTTVGTGMTGSPIFFLKAFVGTGDRIVAQGTTALWYLNGATWANKGTFAASTNMIGSMCQFGQFILAASPNYTGILAWDGGAGNFAAIAGSPKGIRHICADQNYVYAVNQTGTLYWCDSGDHATWPADHLLSIGGEKDTVHDMIFMFGALYIFRESGIWRKTGYVDSEFQLSKISNDRCYSKVATSYDGIYLYNLQGVQKFDGSTCHRISAKINDYDMIPNANGQFMYYQYGQRKLYVPTATQLYVYDELLDRWMIWTIAGMQCAMELGPASGMYFGVKDVAACYQGWSGTTDNGAAITTQVATKVNIDFGSPEVLKRMKHVYADGTFTTTTMTLKSNYGATTEQTFTSPSRINFCTPGGTPQRNFQVSFSGPQGMLVRSLKLVAHPVTL